MAKKFVCTVCGYVHEGNEAPAQCPQCKAPADKFKELVDTELTFVTEHVIGIAKDVDPEIKKGLIANFEGECTEVGMYLAMSRQADREGYPEIAEAFKRYAFEEADHAAQMLTIDERKVCFDGVVTPHVHFLCKDCGKVFDFPLTEEQMYVGCPAKESGFEITEAHVYYKGYCSECKKKRS